jgi:hypothetical protein
MHSSAFDPANMCVGRNFSAVFQYMEAGSGRTNTGRGEDKLHMRSGELEDRRTVRPPRQPKRAGSHYISPSICSSRFMWRGAL